MKCITFQLPICVLFGIARISEPSHVNFVQVKKEVDKQLKSSKMQLKAG